MVVGHFFVNTTLATPILSIPSKASTVCWQIILIRASNKTIKTSDVPTIYDHTLPFPSDSRRIELKSPVTHKHEVNDGLMTLASLSHRSSFLDNTQGAYTFIMQQCNLSFPHNPFTINATFICHELRHKNISESHMDNMPPVFPLLL